MKINLLKLREESHKLSNKINIYEELLNNLNNIVAQSSNYWHDGYSEKFYMDFSIFKNDIGCFLLDLKKIKDLYVLIYENYKELFNYIDNNFDLNLDLNIDNYDIFFDTESRIIKIGDSKIGKFEKHNSNIKDINIKKMKIDHIFNNIDYYEKIINSNFSKYELITIAENNVDEYL